MKGKELDEKIKFKESREFMNLIGKESRGSSHIANRKRRNLQDTDLEVRETNKTRKVIDNLNEDSQTEGGDEVKLMINASSITRLPHREIAATQPHIFRKMLAMDDEEAWLQN